MHFLTHQSKHGWYAGPTDIHIEEANLIFFGEEDSQLGRYCAFANTSLAREYKHLMLNAFKLFCDCLDGRVDLDLTASAERLIGTALARLLLPCS
jgi:hypothetical protein